MSIAEHQSLDEYCLDVARRAKTASAALVQMRGADKNSWLRASADTLREHVDELLAANEKDVAAGPSYGLTAAQTDRLRLTPGRIMDIAQALDEIAMLPEPIGQTIESSIRPNGLRVQKVRAPLGVVFFVYESRPNVTADAAAICVKSGNAVILRGGKEAAHSSRAIVDILKQVGQEHALPADAVQLVSTSDREAVGQFLRMDQYISVAIPRGGEGLIRRVVAEARMPVIKHFWGNCHVYVDRFADLDMAETVTVNSKCQRMGVCNAAESLVVHAAVAREFVPRVARALRESASIELRGDEQSRQLDGKIRPATDADFAAEYLGPVISVKIVDSLDAAIDHVNRYGSGHTDAIITKDIASAQRFADLVDSSAVMVNASTRFNDGGQFGLGAEIGISTDKFQARGPCGLNELTTYKYVVIGTGQIRD
jgi:glutamate-5-semialdehyde dehydrogenase